MREANRLEHSLSAWRLSLLFVAGLFVLPSTALAQRPALPIVAFIGLDSGNSQRLAAFREGLRKLGYEEGVNVQLDAPNLDDRYDRLRDVLTELVRRKTKVIVTYGSTATSTAKAVTSSVPIVMVSGIDPVKAGFAESLAHPGGNITGLSLASQELTAKRLETLRGLMPQLKRIGMLVNPESQGSMGSTKETEVVAKAFQLELIVAEARSFADFEPAFATLATNKVGAVVITPSSMFTADRTQIVNAAMRHRLPTIASSRELVEAGALAAYGTDDREAFRYAATYVDKILRGASPADLPIEQANKYELVINLRTARALGVAIPQSMLLRADRVIE